METDEAELEAGIVVAETTGVDTDETMSPEGIRTGETDTEVVETAGIVEEVGGNDSQEAKATWVESAESGVITVASGKNSSMVSITTVDLLCIWMT